MCSLFIVQHPIISDLTEPTYVSPPPLLPRLLSFLFISPLHPPREERSKKKVVAKPNTILIYIIIWVSLLKKPIQTIIKFFFSVKPTQRHDDIIISKSLFRKLFSFYTLIISYIPKQGHHNMVISSKSLFRIIWNSNTLKKS